MPSKKEPNAFVFATVMCIVCSVLLTSAAVGLKERQERNMLRDKQKNILKALGLYEKGDDIEAIFTEKVRLFYMDESGELSQDKTENPVYVMGRKNAIKTYAIPFKAYGLWSWVYGYLALKGDGKTIAGITVYQHGETPGLGGEVEKDWYQNQFKGKKITDAANRFVAIKTVRGKVKYSVPEAQWPNYVDGISGATITSKGMETYLKEELKKYEPLSKRLRSGV